MNSNRCSKTKTVTNKISEILRDQTNFFVSFHSGSINVSLTSGPIRKLIISSNFLLSFYMHKFVFFKFFLRFSENKAYLSKKIERKENSNFFTRSCLFFQENISNKLSFKSMRAVVLLRNQKTLLERKGINQAHPVTPIFQFSISKKCA